MLDDDHDLAYWPPDVPASLPSNGEVARVLMVGPTSEEAVAYVEALRGSETRATTVPSAARKLHNGTYAVIDDSIGTVLLVVRGAQSETTSGRGRSGYDHTHLAAAYDIYEDHWHVSGQFFGASALHVDDVVEVLGRHQIGRVVAVRRGASSYTITVDIEGDLQGYSDTDLHQLDGDPRSPEFWLSQPPASAHLIARTLSWIKLNHPLTDFLYSFAATRTVFKAYQFLPALKILAGSTGRILIADEVGLGKTIEAGLIWIELEQRSPIRRGLIVVPKSLTVKWQREMRDRFMRPLKILGKPELSEFVHELRQGRDPDLVGIVSLESLRMYREILEELVTLRPRFDVAIVDEAHSLRNRGTRNAVVGDILSDQADHLMLLSATPLNLGSSDLFNLMHLLDADAFPDPEVFEAQLEPNRNLNRIAREISNPATRSKSGALALLNEIRVMTHGDNLARRSEFGRLEQIFIDDSEFDAEQITSVKRLVGDLNTLSAVLNRTRKVDVQEQKALRVVENVEVEWSGMERDLYEEIERFYLDRARRSRLPLGFLMQMPLRQATSCLPVARDRMLQKSGWLGEDERDSEYWDVETGDFEGTLQDSSAERLQPPSWDGNVVPINRDSKLEALRARLRQLRESDKTRAAGVMPQVLIFSYFRGTVEYLMEQLGREFRTDFLHGGVKMTDRETVMERFRRGSFDILIANQVGSEGLDFQFCNILVNYDLPWNPMQIEQRIGRLDRIGQESEKIFIFNMSIPGTVETDIIGRLYTRINAFEQSIGDLEPIMRQTMQEIERRVLDPSLTSEQRDREIERQSHVIERNRSDVKKLEESSGLLTSIGSVEIDGLTENGPASGRYIGASEVRVLTEFVVAKYGGRVTREKEGMVEITGTAGLAVAMNRIVGNATAGSALGADLFRRLRDAEPIRASYRPVDALDVDLISARHPLIRLAVSEMAGDPLSRPQYGRIAIGAGIKQCLAVVTLIEGTGLTQSRELWVTALDLATGERDESVEELVLVGLAEGTLADPSGIDPSPRLRAHMTELSRIEDARVARLRMLRSSDNEALVDARISSQEHTLRIKIRNEERILLELNQRGSDYRIIRLHDGRLSGLQAELARVRLDLEPKRQLVLSSSRVAVLDVLA
ncbi:helicase-related protein [Microbacterium sp. P5_E9]